jgi:hypothetical protein
MMTQNNVVFLYSCSHYAGAPWQEAGFTVYNFDLLNKNEWRAGQCFLAADMRDPKYQNWVLQLKPVFLGGFPECTDLAYSGAKHFYAKEKEDPEFQEKAAELAIILAELGDELNIPWFAENPGSALSKVWRPSDYFFNPCDFGGYLPQEDIHPEYPKYIAPRDAYMKETHLWTNAKWKFPIKKPVEPEPGLNRQTLLLGGKSAKTKYIRSLTPRGFAIANFRRNKPHEPKPA